MNCKGALTLSVAIPTYRRGQSVVETIEQVLSLEQKPDEILVLDQTEKHTNATQSALGAMQNAGEIIWRRLTAPSIPQAMNIALIESDCDVVLFLDDDVELTSEVAHEHLVGHRKSNATVVVGKINQPWQEGQIEDSRHTHNIGFTSDIPKYIDCAMAGNMSVKRAAAIEIGGFDENFVRVAYRFEDEFAQRVTNRGGKIYYHPAASIYHLKMDEGGTRSFGNHLTTIKPYHSVGAYYFFFRAPEVKNRAWKVLQRLVSASITRHHFKKPWWIPITVISEFSGIVWAMGLYIKGPRYLK